MRETYEFLKKCGVFYLATIDNDKPRVRPFGAINIFEDKLYFQTGKIKNVSKQMHQNNHVENEVQQEQPQEKKIQTSPSLNASAQQNRNRSYL